MKETGMKEKLKEKFEEIIKLTEDTMEYTGDKFENCIDGTVIRFNYKNHNYRIKIDRMV